MIDDSLISHLPKTVAVHQDAWLRDFTTFRLGGSCPALIDCPTASALCETAAVLAEQNIEFIVIGQGSNLLVSDAGIDKIVLRYFTEEHDIKVEGCCLRVSGDTLLDDLPRIAIEHGIGDVSFLSGIPGTVGGAIAGNAGAFGKQIGDVIESVRLMDASGAIQSATADELDFEYRSSALKKTGAVVLDAVMKLKIIDREIMRKERERILELRRTKHPDWTTTPCAGSVFRNVEPTSAAERRQAAGWFLEQAGAKDLRLGGARLFDRHANIIIAEPSATASDVFNLSEQMAAAVREKFGFELVREIKLLGVF